jgi:hypothetical protein
MGFIIIVLFFKIRILKINIILLNLLLELQNIIDKIISLKKILCTKFQNLFKLLERFSFCELIMKLGNQSQNHTNIQSLQSLPLLLLANLRKSQINYPKIQFHIQQLRTINQQTLSKQNLH